MLARAPLEAGVRYVEAQAEDLPFGDGAFGLVTVALALHWFDRSRFLAEARRVLEPSGWLTIYDNGFFGEMKGNQSTNGGTEKITSRVTPARPATKSPSRKTSAESTGSGSSGRKAITTRYRFPSRNSPATS